MDFVSAARTRLPMVSASGPTGRLLEALAGGAALNADDSVMASVQLSHWLNRSESGCADAETSTSARRARMRISAGPLSALRCWTCAMLRVPKKGWSLHCLPGRTGVFGWQKNHFARRIAAIHRLAADSGPPLRAHSLASGLFLTQAPSKPRQCSDARVARPHLCDHADSGIVSPTTAPSPAFRPFPP